MNFTLDDSNYIFIIEYLSQFKDIQFAINILHSLNISYSSSIHDFFYQKILLEIYKIFPQLKERYIPKLISNKQYDFPILLQM